MKQELKTIEIVAGPNGSGKTTFAESFFAHIKVNAIYLNPDLIASGFSTTDFQSASMLAGRVLIREVKERIKNSDSFVFESTLSGKTWFGILKDAKSKGYKISIYFLALDNVDANIQRIKSRVALGGHNIPTESVLRRHPRCFDNFWNLYRSIADNWYVFDNSNQIPDLRMSTEKFDALNTKSQQEFEVNFLKGKI